MSNQLRVVLDTNVLVSALIFSGNIAKIRKAWQSYLFIPLASSTTITELIRVLAYPKFKLRKTDQEDLLSDYLPFCDTVKITEPLPNIPSCRDIFNEPFLLLALVGNADYLITGDADLLTLKDDFSCPIITVDDFLKVIASSSNN
ncbi:putative toxin-antitoxin system toxin component, PIN family [Geminocystis sp. GBBB08]|uniref:putative toxin-antitoxin system toxin component, PIN family n=1 Tax=Geminocystis sp. GBBB08 TaxID=2604140 RepID=UPI0027E24C89|nr:putative toxin-antitoxin system toxin component, PIN family [Geminocystis sp. GBBB08]MBL1210588.1 putative toxin-antitoxin system toxin component, PIN family [Geminocystis sp. GBBB08]